MVISKIKGFISNLYKWIWYDFLCRQEPFTYQFTRAMIHHGVFFWIGFYVITGTLFYLLFNGGLWVAILSLFGLFLMAWLTDHLIDHARDNNDDYL